MKLSNAERFYGSVVIRQAEPALTCAQEARSSGDAHGYGRASFTGAVLLAALMLTPLRLESQAPQCPPVTPLRIGPDSIAYIPVEAALRDVLALCPGAQSTWHHGLHTRPALALSFAGLSVLASQNRKELSVDSSADMWHLRGTGAVLPSGISTGAPWRDLRRAYGPFEIVQAGGTFQILPCRLQGVVFFVGDPTNLLDGTPVVDVPAEAIADTTHLTEIWITAGANRRLYRAKGC